MELKKITDFNNVSIEEIVTIIKSNQRETSKMKKEIEKLKLSNIEKLANEIKEIENVDVVKERDMKKTTPIDDENVSMFNDKIDFYYQDLKSIGECDDLYDQIKEVLPSKNNYDYNEIIKGLKFRLLKEINENNQSIHLFKMDTNISDILEFKKQIALDQEKINIITQIQREKNNAIDEKPVENELIFTTTSGGNIRALEEIDHIDKVYYDKFKLLFDSIIDGTFKNVKQLIGNNNFVGISEVKDHKIRVAFRRIGKNAYAIIAVFIKKSDNDKGYKAQLANKINEFRQKEEQMKKLINNPEYIEENRLYKEQLYQKLLMQNKDKVLIKGGNNNE